MTTMTSAFETLSLNQEKTAHTTLFVLVRLAASPTNRTVVAQAFLNGALVAAGSAADNHLEGVISCATQTFTVPVPKGATVEIRSPIGGAGVHVVVIPGMSEA